MRHSTKLLALAVIVACIACSSASHAPFFGFPRALKFQAEQIAFGVPALPPIAHTRLCLQYPDDCEVHGIDFRRRNIVLTRALRNELNEVNREVNREIVPKRNEGGVLAERWLVAPESGECHDYAVTKRHELLARGWPSRSLLLAEVVVPSGEHHLVLVVRLADLDLVLDSLNANIRPVGQTPYQWVKVESPYDPKFWFAVNVPQQLHATMAAYKPE
jgi:predicted transglutaminase-like cysteine proteinase